MSHMNESCHILARVTSHMHEASHIWMHARWSCAFDNYRSVNNLCRIWMSPVICRHESRPICMRHLIYECMHVGHLRSTISNKSRSHVTYEWVLLYMDESRHIWMSHGTYACVHVGHLLSKGVGKSIRNVAYEWVLLYTDESHHTWISQVTHACMHIDCERWVFRACMWVTWRMHVCTSFANNKRLACNWILGEWTSQVTHIWMSHVTYKDVMSRMDVCTSFALGAHRQVSIKCERVTSRMHAPCHICTCACHERGTILGKSLSNADESRHV